MFLCERDLSKECKGDYKDCTDCVLDKIRAELADIADADAYGDYQQGCNFGLMLAAQVIDKYIAEMEE